MHYNQTMNTLEVVDASDANLISDHAQEHTGIPLWSTMLSEGFEGAFPGPWTLFGDPTWDDETYRPLNGSWSGYCAGSSISPPGPYTNSMTSRMLSLFT